MQTSSQNPKDIQYTMIENGEKQLIFAFKNLEPEDFGHLEKKGINLRKNILMSYCEV